MTVSAHSGRNDSVVRQTIREGGSSASIRTRVIFISAVEPELSDAADMKVEVCFGRPPAAHTLRRRQGRVDPLRRGPNTQQVHDIGHYAASAAAATRRQVVACIDGRARIRSSHPTRFEAEAVSPAHSGAAEKKSS